MIGCVDAVECEDDAAVRDHPVREAPTLVAHLDEVAGFDR